MGDLRDMLLKAGLVSEEQAKKAEEAKRASARGSGAEVRPKPPPRPGGKPVAPSREESQRLLKLAQAGKVEGKTRGQRRWYYVSRAGAVPYLELSDEVVRDLEQGNIAIAESERGDAWLVTRECARELVSADPAWLRSTP